MLSQTAFRLIIVLYAISFSIPAAAQKKAVSGFSISDQGDTVKGVFSNYTQWGKNPSVVEFTAATSGNPTRLTTQNCRKFVVEGHEEYLSYTGQRMVNPIFDYDVINKRYKNSRDEQETVTTFLRLVTRTPKCELYVFTDSKRDNFFYKLPGVSLVELRYKKHYNETEVIAVTEVYIVNQIKTVTEYRNQLNNLFPEAIHTHKLTTSLETLSYTEDRLKRFIEKLSDAEQLKRKIKNPAAGWIAAAGTSLNYVKVKAHRSLTSTVKDYSNSISPLLSIGYLFPTNRDFGKYFFYPQLSFFRYENTGDIKDGMFTKYTTYRTDLVVSVVIQGGFNMVNRQSFRAYIAGGIGMMLLRNNKQRDVKYLNSSSSTEPYRSEETSLALKATPSINALAGLEIKNRIQVSATYMLPTKIENAINYNPQYSALQLKIGYKIG